MARNVKVDIPLGPSLQQATKVVAGDPDSGGSQMLSDRRGTRLCRSGRRSMRARGGFSLIEILVVVTIILVVTAISVPNIMQALAQVRLRTAANTVAGLLQQGRIRAVRDNKYYAVIGDDGSGGMTADANIACIDVYVNSKCTTSSDNLDPQVRLNGTNVLTMSAPPATVDSAAGFTSTNDDIVEQDKTLRVYFNSRGLPCAVSGSVCKSTDSSGKGYVYVYYITDQRPIYGWAAVTVSAAGRIRVWMYAGNGVWDQ